jgi:hypothetical protein
MNRYTVTLNDGQNIGFRQGCVSCWDGTGKFEPFGVFVDHDGDENIVCLRCLMAGSDEIAAGLEKKAQDLGRLGCWPPAGRNRNVGDSERRGMQGDRRSDYLAPRTAATCCLGHEWAAPNVHDRGHLHRKRPLSRAFSYRGAEI